MPKIAAFQPVPSVTSRKEKIPTLSKRCFKEFPQGAGTMGGGDP